MLNPVHLRTLEAVVAAGSFADAARRLGYTPSAVSQQISTLERRLDLVLFEREAHSVRATAAGLAVAARAAPTLGGLRTLEADLRRLAGGTLGSLRIGSFPTASERLLPGALSALRHHRPHVQVHLEEAEPGSAIDLLVAGEIDVALVYTYGSVRPTWWSRGLHLQRILDEDVVLITPPGCSTQVDHRRPGLEEHSDATWISTDPDTQGARTLERLCRDHGFEPDVRYRSNNYGVLQGLVSAGLGVALVPELALSPSAEVVTHRIDHPQARRTVSMAASPHVPDELSQILLSQLRQVASRRCELPPAPVAAARAAIT